MSYLLKCSHCQALLKLANPVAAGAKVRCPRCKEVFTADDVSPTVPAETPPASAIVVSPEPPPPLDLPTVAPGPIGVHEEQPPSTRPDSQRDKARQRKKRRRRRKRRIAAAREIAAGLRQMEIQGKKASRRILLLVLSLAGVLGLFVCILSLLIAYHFYEAGFGTPDIVGVWANDQNLKLKTSYEFRRDGVGKLNVGKAGADFTYRLLGSELTIIPPAKAAGAKGPAEELHYRVKRVGNTLELRTLENGVEGPVVVYRKIE